MTRGFGRPTFGLAAVLVLVLVAAPQAGAQTIDPAFRADLEGLLEANGSMAAVPAMMDQTVTSILNVIRSAQPDIPDRVMAAAKEVIVTDFTTGINGPGGLKERLVAIYAAHFTRQDVSQLLAFYTSAIGKKIASVTPAISQEAFTAGQAWGESLSPKIQADLEARLRAEGVATDKLSRAFNGEGPSAPR